MKIQISLGLDSKSNGQLLIDGDTYTRDMANSAYFTVADIVAQVNLTKTSITNFRNAVNAPTSDTKKDTINSTRDDLERNLKALANKVEIVANAPTTKEADRITVIHSAGMDAQDHPAPKKHTFGVENTDAHGTVLLKALGRMRAHLWEYTPDVINFTGRIFVDPTTVAHTEIPNLRKATEYAFFHMGIKAKTKPVWEGPILLVVT